SRRSWIHLDDAGLVPWRIRWLLGRPGPAVPLLEPRDLPLEQFSDERGDPDRGIGTDITRSAFLAVPVFALLFIAWDGDHKRKHGLQVRGIKEAGDVNEALCPHIDAIGN